MSNPNLSTRTVRRSSLWCWLFVSLTWCLVFPLSASAQEEGRFIVVLEPTGSKASKIADPLMQAFRNSNHIVLDQSELVQAGERQGVMQPAFWDDLAVMGQVARAEGIDAIVATHMEKNRKKYALTIYVFDARTGETIGDLAVQLGKKPRLKDSVAEEIFNAANPLILETGAKVAPVVQVTITSTPSGATVKRDNEVLGTTPLQIDVDRSERTELWELVYDDQPAGIARVDLNSGGTYDIALKGVEIEELDLPSEPGDFSTQLALLEVDGGVRLTVRSLDVGVATGYALDYTTNMYPVFALDLVGFPLVAFSKNDYLKSLGLFGSFGYGSLESQLPPATNGRPLEPDSGCAFNSDNTLMICPTTHSEFSFGGVYRLLFAKDAEGHLDATGMALDVSIGYSWLVFDIDQNPTYEGHGYQAVDLGLAFASPLGLPELRGTLAFNYRAPVAFGDAEMIENWGLTAEGLGVGLGAGVDYEIMQGLFARAQYDLSWFKTTYGDTGCQDAACTEPTGAVASDTYHQIGIRVGYRLR